MKKYLLPAIQVLITAGLLWWIFRNPEQNKNMLAAIAKAESEGGLWWFLPGIAALGAALLLQTQRWIVLLRVQNISISYWRALRILLSGMFFNLFLLGSTGGDVIKIFFIMREVPDKKAGALLSVFIDRVVGVLALATVSAVVILARWNDLWHSARMGVLTVALILGGSIGFIAVAWLVDRLNLTSKLPHWLPMHAKIAEAAAAFSMYAKAGGAVGTAFLLSLPAHLLLFSTFYFAAKAFSAGLGLISIFCVMPIVSTVTALPISVGGAGVREGLFIKLLGALYKTPEAIAMTISISGFLMVVFWSLVGGVVYLLYRSSARIGEMEASVEAVEHRIEEQAESGRREGDPALRPCSGTAERLYRRACPMIKVEQLTKCYGSVKAVDGIGFTVEKGEIVGFLGPNGAGKSTTMKMIAGFLPPTSGTIEVAGRDVFRESLRAREHIGYMPENVPLYPDMRVAEYLRYRAALKGVPGRRMKERVEDVLELCGLHEEGKAIIGRLSKGYRQRVGLADAMIHEPDLLILDEPTIGLDPNQIRQVRDLIRNLKRHHTILLSTHILPEVEMLCSRVLIINKGRIEAMDTPQNLRARLGAAGHILLDAKAQDPRAAAAGLRKVPGVGSVSVRSDGDWTIFTIQSSAGRDPREEIHRHAVEQKWPVRELSRSHVSLEQVFASVTHAEEH